MKSLSGSVRSGQFVAEYINPDGELPVEAVQANGVDLSIGEIYRSEGMGYISNEDYNTPDRIEVTPEDNEYMIEPNTGYIVVYNEVISIPENHTGFVLPRSRLMRCNIDVGTAVWDAGDKGVGEGRISADNKCAIKEDTRIAQIVFIKTEDLEEQYSGSHQGERLN